MLWLYQIFIWITWQGALCSQPSGRRTVQIPTMDDCRRQARNEDEHREVEDEKEASVLMRNFDFIYLEYFTGNVVALLLAISLSLSHKHADSHTHTHARTHAHTHTYNRHLCLSLRVVLTNQLCPRAALASSCSFCLAVFWFVSASLWPPPPPRTACACHGRKSH